MTQRRTSERRTTRSRTTGRATAASDSPGAKSTIASVRAAGPDPSRRIFVVLAAFLLIGVAFVAVLVDLQTVRPDRYRDLGEDQRTRTRALAGYRGSILDRDGFVLASSTPGQELVSDPHLINDAEEVAALLGPVLGLDPASLLPELVGSGPDDRYGLLAGSLDEQQVTRILQLMSKDEDNRLRGVVLRPIEERVYPADSLAKPIVGRVDPDERGVSGLEWQFDELLQGHAGIESIERGAFGSITGGEWSVDQPTPGHDVYLTIDHRIQYVVEQALIGHCEEMGARSANSVVSDPRTGEVLAMATVARIESGACIVQGKNDPLVDTFEPGSVLKLVTLAGVVEEFGYTGATQVAVPPSIVIEDQSFTDHPPHPAADFPITQVMADSMNVGTIKLAEQLGPDRLYSYLKAFGFGQESGIGFRYEALGQVREPTDWWGGDRGSIAIGYGITANSLQLLSAYNTIANDGVFISPRLVRALVAADGIEEPLGPQLSRRVVSERTAEEVTNMFTEVVRNGTGTAAAVPGYSVAGKTGTAWKVFDDGPFAGTFGEDGNRKYIVTFAGFLPAENPELSIIVVVDDPVTETTAGKVAAPVFADIAHYVLRILGIPPTEAGLDVAGPVRGTPAGMTEDELWSFQHPGQTRPAPPAPAEESTADSEAADAAVPEDAAEETATSEASG